MNIVVRPNKTNSGHSVFVDNRYWTYKDLFRLIRAFATKEELSYPSTKGFEGKFRTGRLAKYAAGLRLRWETAASRLEIPGF